MSSTLIVPACPLRSNIGFPFGDTNHSAKKSRAQPNSWTVATCTVKKFVQGFYKGQTATWFTHNDFTSGVINTGAHPPYAIQTTFLNAFGTTGVYAPQTKADIMQRAWQDIVSAVSTQQVDTAGNPDDNGAWNSSLSGPGNCPVVDNGTIIDPFNDAPITWIAGEPLQSITNQFSPPDTITWNRSATGSVDTSGYWTMAKTVLDGMTPGTDGDAAWSEFEGVVGMNGPSTTGLDPNSFTGKLTISTGGFNPFNGGGTLLGSLVACGGSILGGGLGGEVIVQKQTAKLIGNVPAPVFVVHWKEGMSKGAVYDNIGSDILVNATVVGVFFLNPGQTIGSDPSCTIQLPFPGSLLPVQNLGTNALISEYYAAIPFSGSDYINQWIASQGYKWGDNPLT